MPSEGDPPNTGFAYLRILRGRNFPLPAAQPRQRGFDVFFLVADDEGHIYSRHTLYLSFSIYPSAF